MEYLLRRLSSRSRLVIVASFDACSSVLSLFAAFFLRMPAHEAWSYILGHWWIVPLFVGIRLLLFVQARLYASLWRYASVSELMAVFKSVSLGSLSAMGVLYLIQPSVFPESVLVIDWMLNFMAIGGTRVVLRMYRDYLYWRAMRRTHSAARRNLIIIGAGDGGEIVAREVLRVAKLRYNLLGFVDDNPSLLGREIHRKKVLGTTASLAKLVEELAVDEVIIAIPSANGHQIRRLVDVCKDCGVSFKTTPGLYDIIGGKVSVSQIRDVEIDDLLGRDVVETDMGAISRYLSGSTVMVTGGGGSIGSELCRQILRFSPRSLIVVDHSEHNVYEMCRELEAKGLDNVTLVPVVLDVTQKDRLERIFHERRPDVVFHAAAYKQVPLMEGNVPSVVVNNLKGSRNVMLLSDQYEVKQFVLISTDKAVNAVSCMGASKRLCEVLMQSIAVGSATKYAAVRFGNVLGSVGSVVPLFREQIAAGGPVTVTHEDMTRFFMTISEAVRLVIQAGALCEGGEIFVLDMGQPVKIINLAQDMIRLSGLEEGQDISIEIIGLRPGERLEEELFFSQENLLKTSHEKIHISPGYSYDANVVELGISRLIQGAESGLQSEELRGLLMDLAQNTIPQDVRS